MIWKTTIVVLASAAFGIALGLAVKAAIQAPTPRPLRTAVLGERRERRAPDPFPANMSRQAKAEADRLQRMTTHRGTEITANDFKPGAARPVTAAFARLDPVPPTRRAHFPWAFTAPDLSVVGWKGFISRMEAAPGGQLVEVHVFPRLEQTRGGIVTTKDRCVERWMYANGTLQFISCVDTHEGGGVASLNVD